MFQPSSKCVVAHFDIDTDLQWAYWDGIRNYYEGKKEYLQGQIGNPDGADSPNKKVYDPRDNTQTFGTVSTYKYSDNPALTFLDYITNNEYGKGLTTSQINMTTISAAATACEVEVDQPYYNNTYQDLTWSGTAGNDFIVINDNDDWWQNKVDEVIEIFRWCESFISVDIEKAVDSGSPKLAKYADVAGLTVEQFAELLTTMFYRALFLQHPEEKQLKYTRNLTAMVRSN